MDNFFLTHFTTGEFSKLCNVNKQTLFHYDSIGIFSPEVKAENGYRYYSVSQLEVFTVISALKELDMPLKDIKKYLDNRSPKELILLLNKEMTAIKEKIAKLEKMHSVIQRKINITTTACNIDTNSIKLEILDEAFLVKTESCSADNVKDMAISIADHINYCEKENIYSTYSIGSTLSLSDIENGIYTNYQHLYTQLDNEDKSKFNFIKDKGVYLIAYHTGGYYTTSSTYKRIIEFIKENNLTVASDFYEDALLDDLSVRGYENYVLKISVMVSTSNTQ